MDNMSKNNKEIATDYKGLSFKLDTKLANGFTLKPDIFVIKYDDPIMADVWGRMYRYSLMREGVCRASIAKLAKGTGWSKRTIIRTIKNLENLGYVTDTTPNLRNRPHIYIVNLAKVNRETRDHFGNKNYAK